MRWKWGSDAKRDDTGSCAGPSITDAAAADAHSADRMEEKHLDDWLLGLLQAELLLAGQGFCEPALRIMRHWHG